MAPSYNAADNIGGDGSKTLASSPVVCRVWKILGVIQGKPTSTKRGVIAQDAHNGLLLKGSTHSDISTSIYSAGHLIALEIGGPDDVRAIVPIDRTLNIGSWRSMEKYIHRCLGDSKVKSATLEVKVSYNSSPAYRAFIPSQFNVIVTFELLAGGSPRIEFRFSNLAEKIDIGGRGFDSLSCLASSSDHTTIDMKRMNQSDGPDTGGEG